MAAGPPNATLHNSPQAKAAEDTPGQPPGRAEAVVGKWQSRAFPEVTRRNTPESTAGIRSATDTGATQASVPETTKYLSTEKTAVRCVSTGTPSSGNEPGGPVPPTSTQQTAVFRSQMDNAVSLGSPASLMAHQVRPVTPAAAQQTRHATDDRRVHAALSTGEPRILDTVDTAVAERGGARKVEPAQHAQGSDVLATTGNRTESSDAQFQGRVTPAFPSASLAPASGAAVLSAGGVATVGSGAGAGAKGLGRTGAEPRLRTITADPTAARTQSGHESDIVSVRLPDDAAPRDIRPLSVSTGSHAISARQPAPVRDFPIASTPGPRPHSPSVARPCEPGVPMALPNTPAAQAAAAAARDTPRPTADLAGASGCDVALRPGDTVRLAPATREADAPARPGAPGDWSPTELDAFKLGIYLFGRELRQVQRLVGSKSVSAALPLHATHAQAITVLSVVIRY